MMKAVVINRALNKKEQNALQKILNSDVKIYRRPDIPSYFSSFANDELIPENDEEKKRINYDLFDEVLNFGELKIEHKAITDWFRFGSVSLWHYTKLSTYFSVRNLYYEISFIRKLLKRYDKIYYYGTFPYLAEYFKNSPVSFFFPGKKSTVQFFEVFKFFVVVLVRTLISMFNGINFPGKQHILIDNTVKQNVLNFKTLKNEKSDIVFCYLNTLADDSFVVLEDMIFPTKKADYRFSVEKWQFKGGNKILGDVLLLRYFFSKKVRKEFFDTLRKLKPVFYKIEAVPLTDVQRLILHYFKKNLGASKLYLYKYIVYKHFFKKHSFKTITTIDENSPRFKSVLDAAKENKIKTVAIQHGTIHDLHPAYLYTKTDALRKLQADYTLVWGEYWKQFLINRCNYPPESVVVTGQIRTDIIPKLLHEKMRVPQLDGINKKIVVFASQPQRDPYLRRKAAEDVFKAVKNRPDSFLILKLHQNERYDEGYYTQIAQSVGITNYKILLWVDLYLLFSRSDLIITCFSTVGGEAVYFNKPLIILDHLKQDIQNYHKAGIAFQATDEHELKDYMDRILDGSLGINKKSYREYVKKFVYKIDGHTTERVLQFIKSLS